MDNVKPTDAFHYAIQSNDAWANYKGHQNPAFFEKCAAGQAPQILWLGCSDSRVPETTVLGLQPGEVFVHRNIANIISPTDINSSAVIEYAVIHLKVKHVVLCGHTGCGGAIAALSDSRVGGVIDTWIAPLKSIRKTHDAELRSIKDDKQRAIRLAELNVEMGVHHLMANHVIEEAMKKRGLQVHGTIYDVGSGKVRDLAIGTDIPAGGPKSSATLSPPPRTISNRSKRSGGNDGTDDDREEEEIIIVSGNHGTLKFEGDEATLAVV